MIGYKTQLGECVCGDSLELLAKMDDESINLVVTSPPFALQRKKSYGNEEQDTYVAWLCQFAEIVYKKLKPDGSFVIDIGGAYEKGMPAYSLYQFEALIAMCGLGFKLAQPFFWYNPSALPAPIEWVNKRKIRAKTAVNTVWWLCKDPSQCKADVRNVLTPYSDRMKKLISRPDDFVKKEGTARPSGHVMGKSTWQKDNGGAIPPNLLQIANSESNSLYLRHCKSLKIKGHPARFPAGLPEFFIKFLTDENDLVVDIFGGSNTTGHTAEKLNRRWKAFELNQEYVAASSFRFSEDVEDAQNNYNKIMASEFISIDEQLRLD